jgi:hypothetical protein
MDDVPLMFSFAVKESSGKLFPAIINQRQQWGMHPQKPSLVICGKSELSSQFTFFG